MNDFLVKSYLNLGKSKEWPRGRKLLGNIDLSGCKKWCKQWFEHTVPACLYRRGGCTLDCLRCGHCMPRRAGGQKRRPSRTVIRLVFPAVMVCLCCQCCAYRRPWSAVVIAVWCFRVHNVSTDQRQLDVVPPSLSHWFFFWAASNWTRVQLSVPLPFHANNRIWYHHHYRLAV